ncbi:Membrane alanyl aminopeptidase Metallo peptidase. MEROPS family M01 [Streptomyces pini]|uniref:Aminopeptidase N n=2 Tax=Streptomyces pini TaxID=1520580 RepID=A0A1I3W868_9ACTN|nr:Membrane alanyl aminopeptidase Metallo peptidase. MEROPS family M01 [Streptomyces pini]
MSAMPALTHEEARSRARLIDVRHYTVDLDLTRGEEVFGSTTTVRFTTREAGDTFVEVRPRTLHRAVLDGHALDTAPLTDGRLPLTGLNAGEHELRIEADMAYSRTGEGMHRFTDPADGRTYLYTMCFQTEAPRVFAAFDQPDLKAPFTVTATAPEEWTVLGNGTAHRVEGEPGRWECATTPPLSTYLMALAAGPWHSVRTEHAGIPFGLHVRQSLGSHLDDDAQELLDITRACFDRYHEIFDEPYPFDSYDQAFVPEFNAGAMENPGLVTFRDEYVHRSAVTGTQLQSRAVTIAHEMAHMWFGDLVTLRWWDDIWLNESFAEYMGYQIITEATRFTGTWTEFAVDRKSWGYDADQRPSTHPVAPEPQDVPDTATALLNFDGISYAKGASALRQLVTWLGEKAFLAGINDHFARHRFGNATLADFLDSLARASGRDVHAWADRWLRTTGVDTLTPHITTDGRRWRLETTHTGDRPHRLTVGLYDLDDRDGTGAEDRLTPREPLTADLPADGGHTLSADGPRPDLVLLNDRDLTYAKVRLDADSWHTARRALAHLPDPLTRATVWNAARDMVRDGHLPPADYLDTARAHLPHERDDAVVAGVLDFARHEIADRYLPPEQRTAALETLTDLVRALLESEPAGAGRDGGVHLTAVRAAIDSATTPGDLHHWWTTGTLPGGRPLDHELRWRLLHRLAVLGAVNTSDIGAAHDADPSATGTEGAARCRAALPDPAAKEAAWQALFDETDTLSNYLLKATLQGFWHAEQQDLLRDYVPRYFDQAPALAARRGPAIAQALGRHGFPRPFTDPGTLALGQRCLADDRLTPALRRSLADELDDLARALRVRAAH